MQKFNAIDLMQKRRYRPDYFPEKEKPVFTIGGKVIGTLQNFILFAGLPKAGKSTYMSAVVGSALIPNDIFNLKISFPINRNKICYIDTESSDYDFYRQMNRIKDLTTLNPLPQNFDAFAVREDNPDIIKLYIEQYLEINKDCSVLVVDGFLDLLLNFNDEVESRKLINWFKKITKIYNILLIGVLHLGKKDGHTLGHLGSMLDRYCQSVLTIAKDKQKRTFTLEPSFLRSSDDFDPIEIFTINGKWFSNTVKTETKESFKTTPFNTHKTNVQKMFGFDLQLDYSELVTEIKEQYAVGTNKAKEILNELKDMNLLLKNKNKKYEANYI